MTVHYDMYQRGNMIMWVDLSTYCNAACPQCHRTNPDSLKKIDWLDLVQWSIDDFKKAFPVKSLQVISEFDFCGTWGDPIMNKDIMLICQYIINNSKCLISINTNGSIRSDDWWAELAESCKNRLSVIFAIDGSTQEIHSKYRQLTNLNLILMNMNAVVYGGSKAKIFTVVFKHNQNDLANIMKLCKQNGAQNIMFIESNRFYDKQDTEFKYTYNSKSHLLEKTTLSKIQLDSICNKAINLAEPNIINNISSIIQANNE